MARSDISTLLAWFVCSVQVDSNVSVYVDRKSLLVVAALGGLVIGAWLLVDQRDRSKARVPSALQLRALDWVVEATHWASEAPTSARAVRYRGPFPDQGMPEDPQPHYVVFEPDARNHFYVVFVEGSEMYTARYRLAHEHDTPKRAGFRYGYGWFDLSHERDPSLEVWRLEGDRWVSHPRAASVSPLVGASFAIDRYDVLPPPDPRNRRHLYVSGSGSNIGDAAGNAECYLLYGSQSQLIEGPYLHVTVPPGRTVSVSGDVLFPKPLDDYESGGVDCRVPKSWPGLIQAGLR